mmetsp:Transcript_7373/g.13712  ORF Transcript_7373/g.13712 Transcript_7373/m.13712 type:complete len:178 (-) Transcript_7373:28-561(-)
MRGSAEHEPAKMDEYSSLLKTSGRTSEWISGLNHVYFSDSCGAFYALMIIFSALTISWTVINFGEFPKELWFLCLEIGLSLIVISEVFLRYVIQGYSTFTSNTGNLFDMCVVLLSVFSLYIALLSTGLIGDIEGLSADVLLIFHFSAQYLRLALFLKNKSQASVPEVMMPYTESDED